MSIIDVKNLKKYYNPNTEIEVQALQDIHLKIERGDFCSIVGVSGSGKSTLLYILGCIDKPTAGIYKLDGEDISKLSEKKLAKIRNKKIGFVLQEFGLIEDETVVENIMIPVMFNNSKNVNYSFRLNNILKELDIDNLKDKKVSEISGGQRQRVAIARALINSPELILADEPTGSLDSKTANNIIDIFEKLNKEGKTIVMVTHNTELAKRTKKHFKIKDGLIYEA